MNADTQPDSFTVVVLDNERNTAYHASEWEVDNPAQRAADAVAEIICKLGTSNVTVTVKLHNA